MVIKRNDLQSWFLFASRKTGKEFFVRLDDRLYCSPSWPKNCIGETPYLDRDDSQPTFSADSKKSMDKIANDIKRKFLSWYDVVFEKCLKRIAESNAFHAGKEHAKQKIESCLDTKFSPRYNGRDGETSDDMLIDREKFGYSSEVKVNSGDSIEIKLSVDCETALKVLEFLKTLDVKANDD